VKKTNNYALEILNILMNREDFISTRQIIDMVGCNRKTVYNAIATLEINGFAIKISKTCRCGENKYRYKGLFGV